MFTKSHSRRYLLLALLLLLTAVAGVRIADVADSHSVPAKTASSSTEAEALSAIHRTANMDHTVKGRTSDSASPTVTEHKLRIDNSRERYLMVLQEVNSTGSIQWASAQFGTEGSGWTNENYSGSGNWHEAHSLRYTGPMSIVAPAPIRQTELSVLSSNQTTLVLQAGNDTAVNSAVTGVSAFDLPQSYNSTLTIVIDRQNQTLSRIAVDSVGEKQNRSFRLVYRYVDVGETRVERPRGTQFSMKEIIGDIVYG
ncbi:hypothetical protein SAMN05216559_1757 [Halomicrobium zhouii]|uniref:Uncharacterized protein n=1 Tax=Halomicrobium zhouii TaxID=767519 RepID=A0A1I6L0L6_9EURY|nr:hypothetical protein SAMN05216559_1757 [Halomicrobium zhouii]